MASSGWSPVGAHSARSKGPAELGTPHARSSGGVLTRTGQGAFRVSLSAVVTTQDIANYLSQYGAAQGIDAMRPRFPRWIRHLQACCRRAASAWQRKRAPRRPHGVADIHQPRSEAPGA
jgi:hypothetical protein